MHKLFVSYTTSDYYYDIVILVRLYHFHIAFWRVKVKHYHCQSRHRNSGLMNHCQIKFRFHFRNIVTYRFEPYIDWRLCDYVANFYLRVGLCLWLVFQNVKHFLNPSKQQRMWVKTSWLLPENENKALHFVQGAFLAIGIEHSREMVDSTVDYVQIKASNSEVPNKKSVLAFSNYV
jgi:hypothetical protein